MAPPVSYIIHHNTFWLLAQKAVYWEEQKTLILADLHLGKTGHFRKEGIAVPQGVYKDDLHRLFHIIQQYKPEQLIIAGDMFHSRMNKEVDLFTRWRSDIAQLHIQLIKGNHDILHDQHYAEAGITVTNCKLHLDKFCFVHDIEDVREGVNRETTDVKPQTTDSEKLKEKSGEGDTEVPKTKSKKLKAKGTGCEPLQPFDDSCYYISGHIHPGVVVRTGTRQSMCLPCYYFSSSYAVLPAFSAFTGTYPVSPKKGDAVFAIVKDSVMRLGKTLVK